MEIKVKKPGKLLLAAAVLLCILAGILFGTKTASAAEKETAKKQQSVICVKADRTYDAVLKKRRGVWYLSCADMKIASKKAGERVVYLKIPRGKQLVSGYYYYGRNGRLDTRKKFHILNTRVNGRRFSGVYYFGNNNGRLYTRRGWVTVGNKKYFLSGTGRRYQNRWVNGYYLKSNGQIAKNMKTPDGYYVNCDGRRCKKEEMRLSSLRKEIKAMTESFGGAYWSVYVKDLKTGDMLYFNDKAMYPASVIKLFVMEGVYEQIKEGRLTKTPVVTSLLNQMITVSDNEAYNALVRLCGQGDFLTGCRNISSYLSDEGYTRTSVHNTLHPSSSSNIYDGLNYSCTKDAGILLEKIYRGKCVSRAYSDEMLSLLKAQTRRNKIPAGLPAGIVSANKTGESEGYEHDAAIVYGSKTDYVVCIYSNTTEASGINGIRQLSAKIYDYLN